MCIRDSGYSLPQILMPYAETGSVKIDFGPAYDLLLEDGSYLILEDPDAAAYPTYLAFENTMQEEVSKDYVVSFSQYLNSAAIALEDGSGYAILEDNTGRIASENGGDFVPEATPLPIDITLTPKPVSYTHLTLPTTPYV